MVNDRTESRKRLLEEFEDSLFRLVMHDVAQQEGQIFLGENEELKSSPSHQPSAEAICTFKKISKKNIRRQKQAPRRGLPRLFYRVSMVLAVLMIVSLTSVITVEAVRVRFLNFMIEVEKEFTSLSLQPSAPTDALPKGNWSDCYMPTYIPEGYKLIHEENMKMMKQLTYQNAEGKVINYSQFDSSTSVGLDTENAAVENIEVNGFEGLLIIKGEYVSVAWSDRESIFTLLTSLDRAEALRVAQSVKIAE